jgi:hypothetical protein
VISFFFPRLFGELEITNGGLTVFFLHEPGLELDVLDHCEQCVRHEYGRDAQSRYEDGEYVGLYADHLGAYHAYSSVCPTSSFFVLELVDFFFYWFIIS